jgi:hypothetical protein
MKSMLLNGFLLAATTLGGFGFAPSATAAGAKCCGAACCDRCPACCSDCCGGANCCGSECCGNCPACCK